MADRYEIRKRLKCGDPWSLHRIDDDAENDGEFAFDKLIGTFEKKAYAESALEQIKDHENMNFAEWFYVQRLFYKNDTLDQGTIAKHLYKLWRAIGGHLSVDTKRDIMTAQAVMLTYVMSEYAEKIDDIEMAHAQQQAGASW